MGRHRPHLGALGLNGPCYFTFGIGDRPPVVRNTVTDQFNDWGFAYASLIQTYPSVVPDFPRVMGTGATAVQSLGVIEKFNGGRVQFPADCRFHLDLTLPHVADTVVVQWAASGLIGSQKNWGLADVKVEALSANPAPTRDQLDQWWQAAIAPDPVPARAAFLKLLAADDATAAYLLQRHEPPPFNTNDVVARMQALAASDPFDAQRDLVAMGPGVEALLSARPELADLLGTRAGKSLVAVYEATELRPIESLALRAAAVKAKLLAQIASPSARQALVDWFATGPAWQPDLPRKFESDYRLEPGQAVKYVPTPDPAARSDYLRRRAKVVQLAPRNSTQLFQTPPADGPATPIAFTVVEETPDLYAPLWADEREETTNALQQSAYAAVARQLPEVIRIVSVASIGNKPWIRVAIPKELRTVELPGDWVVRFHATQRQLMTDLATALSARLGRPVAVTLDPSGGEVTSVLTDDPTRPATQPAAGAPQQVDLYTDAADRARPAQRVWTLQPAQLSRQLYYLYGRKIQIKSSDDHHPIAVSVHPGASRSVEPGESLDPENAAFIDGVIDHLAEQLGMRRENQPLAQPAYRITVSP